MRTQLLRFVRALFPMELFFTINHTETHRERVSTLEAKAHDWTLYPTHARGLAATAAASHPRLPIEGHERTTSLCRAETKVVGGSGNAVRAVHTVDHRSSHV